jgi:hypothetical protein
MPVEVVEIVFVDETIRLSSMESVAIVNTAVQMY